MSSSRKRRKAINRKIFGNPWDSSSSDSDFITMNTKFGSPKANTKSSSSASTIKKISLYKKPKKSSFKSRKSSNRISFRSPLIRSKSSTSTSHAVWKTVSSKSASSRSRSRK